MKGTIIEIGNIDIIFLGYLLFALKNKNTFK